MLGDFQVKRMLNFHLDTNCNHQNARETIHGSERDDLVLPLRLNNHTLNQEQMYSVKPTLWSLLGGLFFSFGEKPSC